jgi:hypothetical protein
MHCWTQVTHGYNNGKIESTAYLWVILSNLKMPRGLWINRVHVKVKATAGRQEVNTDSWNPITQPEPSATVPHGCSPEQEEEWVRVMPLWRSLSEMHMILVLGAGWGHEAQTLRVILTTPWLSPQISSCSSRFPSPHPIHAWAAARKKQRHKPAIRHLCLSLIDEG